MTNDALKIGVAGLGTVGIGVLKILVSKCEVLTKRSGRKVDVVAVSARDKNKERDISLEGISWLDDPLALADDDNIDVVVELIGGADGIAYELAKKSLENKKSFVTANKALIATHGLELAKIAEKNDVDLAFEASVAGGIPVIGAIKQGLSGNNISRIVGILNGTCNYILTAMQKDERSFDDALKEAQELGYAEADPTFDVGGIDTAHKLSILTSIAFGVEVNLDKMHIEGINNVSLSDIKYVQDLGYKIKLLGITEQSDIGIEQRIHPCLVPVESPISQVDGVINAVAIESDSLGPLLLEGAGAGELPTASSVVADIIDIAADRKFLPFNMPANSLEKGNFLPMSQHVGEYYVRLTVRDEPGVLAAVTSALSEQKIGVEQVLQPHTKDQTADIVITTHKVQEQSVKDALTNISKMEVVLETPHVIRIEA